jgi:hypothetical protein
MDDLSAGETLQGRGVVYREAPRCSQNGATPVNLFAFRGRSAAWGLLVYSRFAILAAWSVYAHAAGSIAWGNLIASATWAPRFS